MSGGMFGSSCYKKHGGMTVLTHMKGTPGPQATLYWNAQKILLTRPPWRESRWTKTAKPHVQLDPRAKGTFQQTPWTLLPIAQQFWGLLSQNAGHLQCQADLESKQCACPAAHLYCPWWWCSWRAAWESEEADGDSKISLILQYKELQESGLRLPFLVTQGLKNLFFLVSESVSHRRQGPNRALLDCHPSPKAILPLFHTSGNWADYEHLLAVGGNGIEFCPMKCE